MLSNEETLSEMNQLVEHGHILQTKFPHPDAANMDVDGSNGNVTGISIGRDDPILQSANWRLRDSAVSNCRVGLDVRGGSQFGKIQALNVLNCTIGERVMAHPIAGGGNSITREDVHYIGCDVGSLHIQNGSPRPNGSFRYRNVQFHQCRVGFSYIGNPDDRYAEASFDGIDSEYDATPDMPVAVSDIPDAALINWRSGGRVLIRNAISADDKLVNLVIADGPAKVVLDNVRLGIPATSYAVLARHPEAAVYFKGPLIGFGHVQNVRKYPDGYENDFGDWSAAISMDGDPLYAFDVSLQNHINPRSFSDDECFYLKAGQSLQFGPLAKSNIGGQGPMFFSCIVENMGPKKISMTADTTEFAPHKMSIEPEHSKRFVQAVAGQHMNRNFTVCAETDCMIRMRRDHWQFLWGPRTTKLMGQISKALRSGGVGPR